MGRRALIVFAVLIFVLGINASHIKDWQKQEAAHPAEKINFFVALKQRYVDQLEVCY